MLYFYSAIILPAMILRTTWLAGWFLLDLNALFNYGWGMDAFISTPSFFLVTVCIVYTLRSRIPIFEEFNLGDLTISQRYIK